MRPQNTQLTSSSIIQNWRTITVPKTFLSELQLQAPPEVPPPKLDEAFNSDTFVNVSADDFQKETTTKTKPVKEKVDDSTSSFFDIADDDHINSASKLFTLSSNAPTIQLTNEQIITLSNALDVQFTGAPADTTAGFYTITRRKDERDLTFAKRRLAAITPPLLYTGEKSDPELQQKIAAINAWHKLADLSTQKPAHTTLEAHYQEHERSKSLAETCFFYDKTYKRLIIRHTPIDTVTNDDVDNSRAKLTDITTHLIKHITKKPQEKVTNLRIHHIIPTIEKVPGFDEFHIVLTLVDQWKVNSSWVFHGAVLDSKEKIPLGGNIARENLVYTLLEKSKRYYLEVQNWKNWTDCGKHITIMAIAVMRLLTQNHEESIGKMALEEFEPFKPKIIEAAMHFDPCDFKLLLSESEKISAPPRTQKEQQPKPPCSMAEKGVAKMMQFAAFAAAAATSSGISFFNYPNPAAKSTEKNQPLEQNQEEESLNAATM